MEKTQAYVDAQLKKWADPAYRDMMLEAHKNRRKAPPVTREARLNMSQARLKGKPSKTPSRGLVIADAGNKCVICDQGDIWNKETLVFTIHHIDRNTGNNASENLLLLCPNCHSQQHKKR